MRNETPPSSLLASVDAALELLADYRAALDDAGSLAAPLPSLLKQCDALCSEIQTEPVRMLHHFAFSGGTVISRCVAAAPNAVLLSEIDPLSKLQVNFKNRFAPTDLLLNLRRSVRPIPERTLVRMFQASLGSLHEDLSASGQILVLRDHPHSQFCSGEQAVARPTLREIVTEVLPARSVVTQRHPLDSFLSLDQMKWHHFKPFTLEEYAQRILAFLARHEGAPVVLYEEFVEDPEAALSRICDGLELSYNPIMLQNMSIFGLSGDSGRKGRVVTPRERRPVPPEIAAQRETSAAYLELCKRFGYTP